MHETSAILSVENLSIRFGGTQPFTAVDGLSFNLEKGKVLAIVGESGSGKSLTALALMGLLPKPAKMEGTISLYAGAKPIVLGKLNKQAWQDTRGKLISMVFQEPMSALNPVMKIGEQLSECIRTHQKLNSTATKQLAIGWLQKVQLPEPAKLYDRYPHQLSGGQKQRVMIAMAMCNHPAVLIADEPTTALDVTVQKEIIALMQDLQKEAGTAMLFITHDLALAAEIADDMLVMYKGQCIEYGPAEAILRSPQQAYTQALIACRPAAQQKGKRLPVVADFLNATEVEVQQQYSSTVSDDAILQVNDLKIWFAEHTDWLGRTTEYFKAVDHVSFELKKGEVLGLVGESGCGKSTLSKSLLGLLPVKEGQIIFKGQDISKATEQEWKGIRKNIQMIFQDPYGSLNPRLTIGEMLTEPMRVHHIVPNSELKKEAQRLLDLVQLPADAFRRYPHQFSGGQRQRIGIARALALRPQLLVCDESVSALDVSVQAQILNLLKELQAEFQLSYLFISHDLNVVHYISDRVMVMQAGHIVEQGTAEQVLKQPEHPYTRRLIAAMPKM